MEAASQQTGLLHTWLKPRFEVAAGDFLEEAHVVVVDDDATTLALVARVLKGEGYQVRVFSDPRRALAVLEESPPSVLVTDRNMPTMTGLTLAEKTLEADPSVQVLLMTGGGGEAAAQAALELGVSGYLLKPLDPGQLCRAVRRAVLRRAEDHYGREARRWYQDELERRTRDLERVTTGALGSLVRAYEAKSAYFVGHSERVAVLATRIARELSFPSHEVGQVRAGALLHDVGMIAVSDAIVQKPTVLTDTEMSQLKRHCEQGAAILDPLTQLADASRFVLEHHERVDGSGYPAGLAGDEISRGGQIVGISEAWTAMHESRPHRPIVGRGYTFEAFREQSGKGYAPELMDALGRVVSEE